MTKRKAKNEEKTKKNISKYQKPSITKSIDTDVQPKKERAKCIIPDEEQSITLPLTFSCDLHFELGFAMQFHITLR